MSRGIRTPLAVLAIACVAFVAYVLATVDQLPPKVATHFNARGLPDGWMTRSAHTWGMIGFGIGVPMFIVVISSIVRIFSGLGSYINLPHREYWLAPERRQQTRDYLFAWGLWLACFMVAVAAGLHQLILTANLRQPVALSTSGSGWLAGGASAGVAVWILALIIRFLRRPDAAKA
jgi:uncharacterized membrane protein